MISHSCIDRSCEYKSTFFDCLRCQFEDMNYFKSEVSCSNIQELWIINLDHSVSFRIGYYDSLCACSLDSFNIFFCDLSRCIDHTDREHHVTIILLLVEKHKFHTDLIEDRSSRFRNLRILIGSVVADIIKRISLSSNLYILSPCFTIRLFTVNISSFDNLIDSSLMCRKRCNAILNSLNSQSFERQVDF